MAKKGLGRGLEAILGDVPQAEPRGGVDEINISDIAPDKDQPRKQFDEAELAALAESVGSRGVLQPILVRPKAGGQYTIIAGERRWRAAQRAGLHKIPALIKDVEEGASAEIALIENVQRVDLNPMEEADGYQLLADRYGKRAGEIAEAVGKSRSHVANMLRLVALPVEVRGMVTAGELSMGHARALLSAEKPIELAKRVVKEDLSVRATEKLVASGGDQSTEKLGKAVKRAVKDADTRALEQDLRESLGIDVDITRKGSGGAGKMVLSYDNLDQLDDLCRKLMGSSI
ncbi:ParB/RepB/Spo0J family partition protein [Parvularcula sp. ZS-1/3]|uniref:ParB/RepB/Spo0J family partition protein n=1 Tax=Parvularcula mediterranea TaxID=2732508 RepID=A0A7Y3RKH8_9PROT|nr:ParB/RepB/Spo0J family partition protein [Parvularcula mediterranea]NNU15724.1 ParB/RepB/Spo0J family partition protein [Parvularcula mediterranea]